MNTLTITVPPGKRYDYDGEVELPFRLEYAGNDQGYYGDCGFAASEIERRGAPGTKVENVRVVEG